MEAVSRDAFLLDPNDNRMAGFKMAHLTARRQVGDACVIPAIIRLVDWNGAPCTMFQSLASGCQSGSQEGKPG